MKRKATYTLKDAGTQIDTMRISFNPKKIKDLRPRPDNYSKDPLREILHYLEEINNSLVKAHKGTQSVDEATNEFMELHVENGDHESYKNVIKELSQYKFFLRPTLDWLFNKKNYTTYTIHNEDTIYTRNMLTRKKETLLKYMNSFYDKSVRGLQPFVEKEIICDTINPGYIEDALKDCDAVFEVIGNINKTPTIMGVAILYFNTQKSSLFIDILCSNKNVGGVGSKMIEYLDALCGYLKLRGVSLDRIELNSLTGALGFYVKTNFTCYDVTTGDDTCKMIRNISEKYDISNKSESRKRSRSHSSKRRTKSRSHNGEPSSFKRHKTKKNRSKQ